MQSERRGNSDRERIWRKIVGGFPGGGVTVRGYCRKCGVNEAAFFWWRRELARRDSAKPSPAFLPVVVQAPVEAVDRVEAIKAGDCVAAGRLEGVVLELRGRRTLRMPSLSLGQILKLIRAIEGAA